MSEKEYKKLVENKSKLSENVLCVDCDARNPKWASVRYGTFFCLDCAAFHRNLGIYLDFVKSVSLDGWDKEAYLPIEYGGNRKFKEYLEENNLERLELESKYKNSLVIEYSKNLMKKIFDETGIELKASEKKSTSASARGRFVEKPVEFIKNEQAGARSCSSSNLSSSLSSIGTILGGHVKSITEKTVEYGAKIGSTVKHHAINLVEKGLAAVSNIRKEKQKNGKPNIPTKTAEASQQRHSSQQDWS